MDMDRRNFIKACAAAGLYGTATQLAWASTTTESDLYQQSFTRLDGETQTMQRYLGKPLLVNFWATWCPPCVKEMPDLDALSKAYPDIHFLGIAVDTSRNVNKFLLTTPVSYDLLVAGHRGVQLMRGLGNSKGGLPFTLLFDAEGVVQHQVLGQIEKAALAAVLAGHVG